MKQTSGLNESLDGEDSCVEAEFTQDVGQDIYNDSKSDAASSGSGFYTSEEVVELRSPLYEEFLRKEKERSPKLYGTSEKEDTNLLRGKKRYPKPSLIESHSDLESDNRVSAESADYARAAAGHIFSKEEETEKQDSAKPKTFKARNIFNRQFKDPHIHYEGSQLVISEEITTIFTLMVAAAILLVIPFPFNIIGPWKIALAAVLGFVGVYYNGKFCYCSVIDFDTARLYKAIRKNKINIFVLKSVNSEDISYIAVDRRQQGAKNADQRRQEKYICNLSNIKYEKEKVSLHHNGYVEALSSVILTKKGKKYYINSFSTKDYSDETNEILVSTLSRKWHLKTYISSEDHSLKVIKRGSEYTFEQYSTKKFLSRKTTLAILQGLIYLLIMIIIVWYKTAEAFKAAR